jgi:co-chaperonin GroES (HSP10)|tara:strand:- start:69 stop:326 length:258 start_codon:yes stop_codon:yes gene_type:complete
MKAINYYIVIEKIKEEPREVGGLIIAESKDTEVRYKKAKVITVGDKVQGVVEDDIIFYDKHAGHGISYKEKVYTVINLGDVVLVE